uniref:Uncharacterized protein n=1 Tax=Arundo donax TaxID=35708 RepID=A0A0A9HQD5_ARUDO
MGCQSTRLYLFFEAISRKCLKTFEIFNKLLPWMMLFLIFDAAFFTS